MTARERYIAYMQGRPVDRIPFRFGGPRASTFAAWRKQGLSADLQARFHDLVGADASTGIGKLNFGPVPKFPIQILEVKDGKAIWIDEWGVKRLDAIRQATPGFATRAYLEFPVKTMDDLHAMMRRYNPASPERFEPQPEDNSAATLNPDWYRIGQATASWRDRIEACNDGGALVHVTIPWLYWTARDWCGFEGLSELLCDNPRLVHELMEFWTDFVIRMLDEPLSRIKVDKVTLNEDMAYKTAAMLSPAMMREFMLPRYKRIYSFLKSKGVDVVLMDSDGHNSQILDVFYPTAIDGIEPMEIAANNDPADYLARHPGIAIEGGIDKRELRFDYPQARKEIVRRFAASRQFGRYIPGVDHGVPPDVPVRTYLYMVELIKGLATGQDLDTYEPPCELQRQLGPVEEMFDPIRTLADHDGEEAPLPPELLAAMRTK
jgi:uroporphyrinogen decarboxylase